MRRCLWRLGGRPVHHPNHRDRYGENAMTIAMFAKCRRLAQRSRHDSGRVRHHRPAHRHAPGRHSKPGADAVCDRQHAFRGRGCRPLRLGKTDAMRQPRPRSSITPKAAIPGCWRLRCSAIRRRPAATRLRPPSRSTSTSACTSSRCRSRPPAASPRILPELILPAGSCALCRVGGCHGAAATSGSTASSAIGLVRGA